MPRYEFDVDARPELLTELVAAGLPATTPVEVGDGKVWVTVDEADLATVQAVIDAHDAAAIDAAEDAAREERRAARQLVLQVAQSAVGLRFDALTAAQTRALVAILLWKEGALTGGGFVRPLSEWVQGD